PLTGCADHLGIASASETPVAKESSSPSPSAPAGGGHFSLTSEQPLPTWLTSAVKLFAEATTQVVEMPPAPAPESSSSADATAPGGEIRWIEATEAQELGRSGRLAPVPSEFAGTLGNDLTSRSFEAFEESGRHWGVPLSASWLGLIVDPESLPAGEAGAPPL